MAKGLYFGTFMLWLKFRFRILQGGSSGPQVALCHQYSNLTSPHLGNFGGGFPKVIFLVTQVSLHMLPYVCVVVSKSYLCFIRCWTVSPIVIEWQNCLLQYISSLNLTVLNHSLHDTNRHSRTSFYHK